MAKWVCNVCGYVHEGETAPEVCPICKAPADKFTKQDSEMTWAAEHVVGVAQGVSEDILADLRANFAGGALQQKACRFIKNYHIYERTLQGGYKAYRACGNVRIFRCVSFQNVP